MSYRIAQEDAPDSPWPIFERVLEFPELAVQASLSGYGVRWAFMFRLEANNWQKNGRMTLGTACMPGVNGALSGLFDQLLEDAVGYWPDFLITLNEAWWEEASDLEREILVVHELHHCAQALDKFGSPKFTKDGGPVLAIKGHDVEEFTAVVARYGAWKGDLVEFAAALRDGMARPNGEVMGVAGFADLVREVIADATGATGKALEDLSPDDVIKAIDRALEPDACDSAPQGDSSGDVF